MKRGSTVFLRLAVLTMGSLVILLCISLVPAIYREWTDAYPDVSFARYPVILGLIATAVAFFVALVQTLKLLNYVDKNKAFSKLSVKALRNIKYCGVVIGGIYIAGLPVIYHMAQEEDAPGLMLIGLIIAGAAISVAVFAAVLERLLQSAIALKKENDLTV